MSWKRWAAVAAVILLVMYPAAAGAATVGSSDRATLAVNVQPFPLLGFAVVTIEMYISPPLDGGQSASIVDWTTGQDMMTCVFGPTCFAVAYVSLASTAEFVGEIQSPPGGAVVQASRGFVVANGELTQVPSPVKLASTPPSQAATPSAPPASTTPSTPAASAPRSPSSAEGSTKGPWSVPFSDTNNQLMVACSIDGQTFSQCILDTGDQLSAVIPPSIGQALGISPTEDFTLSGFAGSAPAYAGPGTISIGGQTIRALITVASSDNLDYPNIGLSSLQAMCFNGNGAVAFDWHKHVLACVAG